MPWRRTSSQVSRSMSLVETKRKAGDWRKGGVEVDGEREGASVIAVLGAGDEVEAGTGMVPPKVSMTHKAQSPHRNGKGFGLKIDEDE